MKQMLMVAAISMMPAMAMAKMKVSKFQAVPVDSPLALGVMGLLVAVLAVRFMRKR